MNSSTEGPTVRGVDATDTGESDPAPKKILSRAALLYSVTARASVTYD